MMRLQRNVFSVARVWWWTPESRPDFQKVTPCAPAFPQPPTLDNYNLKS